MTPEEHATPEPGGDDVWTCILTRPDFEAFCADRIIRGDGTTVVLSRDGRLHGRVGEAVLEGRWHWENGLFCRTATFDGVALDLDREIIERQGNLMRYTRDAGRGPASVVQVTQGRGR